MSEGIKVDFAEIDRLTTRITSVNAFAGPLVPKVGALSTDGDLLASAVLSPGTALAAEGAVMNASAQLGITLVATEALVIITASIPKVYETAEQALAIAAAGLEVTWRVTEPVLAEGAVRVGETLLLLTTGGSAVSVTLLLVVGSLAAGFLLNTTSAAAMSLAEAFDGMRGAEDLTNGSFAADLNAAWDRNFSWSNMWTDVTSSAEQGLGLVPGGYDALLFAVFHDGRALGLFDDGHSVKYRGDPKKMHSDADEAVQGLQDSVPGIAGQLDTDPSTGAIIPHSLADVYAGAAQIDNIGKKEFADIRIIERKVDGESYFTVQIPSTQRWFPMGNGNPWGQQAPNDFTSDLIALREGDQTALAEAVKQAMREAKVGKHPVLLTGFSLGGITAAAIAQGNDGEFNIQQVATAGAPIGRMDIPSSVRVTALEAPQDAVPKLDGTPNPSSWGAGIAHQETATIGGDGASATMSPKNVHDAARYAQMAKNYSSRVDPGLSQFLGSAEDKNMTVTDFQAVRK